MVEQHKEHDSGKEEVELRRERQLSCQSHPLMTQRRVLQGVKAKLLASAVNRPAPRRSGLPALPRIITSLGASHPARVGYQQDRINKKARAGERAVKTRSRSANKKARFEQSGLLN